MKYPKLILSLINQRGNFWIRKQKQTMSAEKTDLSFFVTEDTLKVPERLCQSTWLEHIPFCFWLTSELKPNFFVELGTYYGSSYFSVCQMIEQHQLTTRCFAIDTWKGDEQSGFYEDEVYNSVNSYNQKKYSHFSTLIRSSFEQALPYFENNSIDMLHIDGYHTYEEVKNDFESWKPRLTQNAIVLFHDINVKEREFGVCKLWQELTPHYLNFEFLHGCGLGILALGSSYPEKIKALFNPGLPPNVKELIKKYFSRLGSGINYMFLHENLKSGG